MEHQKDKLDDIFEMQKELVSDILNRDDRFPLTLDGRLSSLATAIIHEATELQRLTNWKWWKKEELLDLEGAKEELIDILHFVIHTALELGMSPNELYSEFKRKHEINRKRQKNNY